MSVIRNYEVIDPFLMGILEKSESYAEYFATKDFIRKHIIRKRMEATDPVGLCAGPSGKQPHPHTFHFLPQR